MVTDRHIYVAFSFFIVQLIISIDCFTSQAYPSLFHRVTVKTKWEGRTLYAALSMDGWMMDKSKECLQSQVTLAECARPMLGLSYIIYLINNILRLHLKTFNFILLNTFFIKGNHFWSHLYLFKKQKHGICC